MTSTQERLDHPQHLVETDWLEKHLYRPDLRIFDCTVDADVNPDPELAQQRPFVFESGRAQFDRGHIPGAGFIDLLDDLSDKASLLPFMMPSADNFAAAMSRNGIGQGNRVVLYSTLEPMWATRVWWMLRAMGFDAMVLNGGWNKWQAEGRPEATAACTYPPARFVPQPRAGAFADKDEVLATVSDGGVCTISALPPAMYAGTGGPVFGRKGHIAGSVNVPHASLNDPDTGVYLPIEQLQQNFDAVGATQAERIIVYCGGAIAATNDAFALTLLGYTNVGVYDGSMFEWGNDPSLPMETGGNDHE